MCGACGSCYSEPHVEILLAGLGFAYLIGSMVVNLVGIAFIVYFVVKGQWLQAIFSLLARKELVGFMYGESKRLTEVVGTHD